MSRKLGVEPLVERPRLKGPGKLIWCPLSLHAERLLPARVRVWRVGEIPQGVARIFTESMESID